MKKLIIITLLLLALTTGIALAQAPEGKEYIVQAGDSLSAIAKKEYGNPQAFPAIVEATNAKAAEDDSFTAIADPNVIEARQKLWLPATAEGVAAAQPAPAAPANGLGDTYYPLEGNPGYDVQHYTIELTVDVETNTIEGSTTIEALATSDLPTFNLDFMGLEISAVSVDGSEAEFSRNGQELTITPATPIAAKASFTVNVAYNGVPEPNPDPALAIVPALNGWRSWGEGIVGAANQPDGAMTWFPSNNHPTDKATFTFRITVDDPNVAVASGILQEVVPAGDNTNTYVWEMDAPMATQIAFVMAGKFERVESVAPNGVPIRYYFPPGTDQADINAFEVTGEMMVYLEDLLGPYPFDAYGAIIIPDYIGDSALETQSLATFDDYGPEAIPDETVIHELFHQWYGNTLTLADWGDLWLHEGFAKYSEVLWYQHTGRLDEANAILTDAYNRQLAVAGMPEEMTGNPPLEAGKVYPAVDHGARITFLVSYDAGVLAVHNLRMTVGDEAFFDILRTFYEENKNTPVTTEDFIATAEKVTGRDLSDWADVWVYGTTIPADFPLLTSAQAAPAAPADGLGDAYFPQEGYPGLDAQHYTIELTVDPADLHSITGTTTIEMLATTDLPRFNLDFLGLNVTGITVDGAPATFSREGQELIITPAQTIAANSPFTVSVGYAGTPEFYDDPALAYYMPPLIRIKLESGWAEWSDGYIAAFGQPDGSMTWFPSNNHPGDKATYTYRVTVAEPKMAIATGILQEVIPVDDNTNTYVWQMNEPMATQIASVILGEFELHEGQSPNGVPLRNYFPPNVGPEVVGYFAKTGEMIDFLSNVFGEYPYEAYGVVAVPGWIENSGLETQSITTVSPDPITEETIVHELGHQWFANSLTVTEWGDVWLHEGFARYIEALWREKTKGVAAYNDLIKEQYNNQLDYPTTTLPPMLGLSPLPEGQVVPPVDQPIEWLYWSSYTGGALALHNLRMEVGDEVFFKILPTFYQRHANGNATTEDFIATAEEISGRDLSGWADTWLYSNTIPADFPLLTEAYPYP